MKPCCFSGSMSCMIFRTFSCISCVDWASQKATVARSLRMGISTVQSRPSSSATRGRGCIGPFIIWGRIPAERRRERREGVNYLCLAHAVKWAAEEAGKCRKGTRQQEVFAQAGPVCVLSVWWDTHTQLHTHLTVCSPSTLNHYHHLPYQATLVDITHTNTHTHTKRNTHTHTHTHTHTMLAIWIPPSLAVIHTVTRQQVLSPHEVITSIILSPYRSRQAFSVCSCVCVCVCVFVCVCAPCAQFATLKAQDVTLPHEVVWEQSELCFIYLA